MNSFLPSDLLQIAQTQSSTVSPDLMNKRVGASAAEKAVEAADIANSLVFPSNSYASDGQHFDIA